MCTRPKPSSTLDSFSLSASDSNSTMTTSSSTFSKYIGSNLIMPNPVVTGNKRKRSLPGTTEKSTSRDYLARMMESTKKITTTTTQATRSRMPSIPSDIFCTVSIPSQSSTLAASSRKVSTSSALDEKEELPQLPASMSFLDFSQVTPAGVNCLPAARDDDFEPLPDDLSEIDCGLPGCGDVSDEPIPDDLFEIDSISEPEPATNLIPLSPVPTSKVIINHAIPKAAPAIDAAALQRKRFRPDTGRNSSAVIAAALLASSASRSAKRRRASGL